MALFMDVHPIEGGVSAADVAAARRADLETQWAYGVSFLRYWVDESAGEISCLVEAEDVDAATTVDSLPAPVPGVMRRSLESRHWRRDHAT